VNASNHILGSAGVVGSGLLRQPRRRSYLNAPTGNLVLQSQHAQLPSRGTDLLARRTYNSRGLLPSDDVDGDGWRRSSERTVLFTAGSNGEGRNVGGK